MITRRLFVQSGLFVAAAGALPLATLAAGVMPDRAVLQQVIHDSRYPDTEILARNLLRSWQGLTAADPLRRVAGDITGLWRDELRCQWQGLEGQLQAPFVAGASGADVLFCLEQLAADHGLRVLWRQQQNLERYTAAGEQALLAWFIGPLSTMPAVLASAKSDRWSL